MVEKIGGRKAAACLTGMIVVVGCLLLKGSLPSELVQAVQYLVTTYLAGNVMSDVVQNVAAVHSKKAEAAAIVNESAAQTPEYDDTALNQRISSLETALQQQNNTITQVVNFLSNPPAAAQGAPQNSR
jgi:hypothetical protein